MWEGGRINKKKQSYEQPRYNRSGEKSSYFV